jgi:hypothetical protein
VFLDYNQLVPKRFAATTRISNYQFGVNDPWWSTYDLVETSRGTLQTIEASAFCRLRIGNEKVPLLVPQSDYPTLAGAVMGLGRLQTNGSRSMKYLELFKIYEGLQKNVELPFAAVRHALAHSPKVLNRPKTVLCLTDLFGSVRLDLENAKHQKIFWRLFVDLLIAVDSVLSRSLIDHAQKLRLGKLFRRPITHHLAIYEMPTQYQRLLTNASSRPSAVRGPRAAETES